MSGPSRLTREQIAKIRELLADLKRIWVHENDTANVDYRLGGLQLARLSLGENALEVIKLGLSRVIRPTIEDAKGLIIEWERRGPACCFSGSVTDLLALKNTQAVAVSYRHDDSSRWKRKGDDFKCKMGEKDQEEFTRAIKGLAELNNTTGVTVWCDQVLSTRLHKGKKHSFGWYNAGLLPYLCLPVLNLSTKIPEEDLEQRIWIRAERSLGRLGQGVLSAKDAALGMCPSLGYGDIMGAVKNISLMILSEYWPEDTGYWANDYQEMKKWALGLLRKPKNSITEPPLFEEIRPVDNLEILLNLPQLTMLPLHVEFKERPLYTEDSTFFLRATSWNLSLIEDKVWKTGCTSISHYLGRLGPDCRFSWWIEKDSGTIFGCLTTMERATMVLAVKSGSGYKVFRREGNPMLYKHKENRAGQETKTLISEMAEETSVEVDTEAEWRLLYSCDEDTDMHKTDSRVKAAMGQRSTVADALVPYVFVGVTTSLLRAAVANCGDEKDSGLVVQRVLHLFDRWNTYIRTKYDNFVSVRDTILGPVWLEGFTEKEMTFGFLDFLAHNLIIGKQYISSRTVSLPKKWDVVKQIRSTAGEFTEDLNVLQEELFRSVSEQNCEASIATHEVAMFMISGGFSSGFGHNRLTSWLVTTIQRRGYWSTEISCRDGRIQILLENGLGDVRMFQRTTTLGEFTANGFVHLEDAYVVVENSEEVTEDREARRSLGFWKSGMEDNMPKSEMMKTFKRSFQNIGNGRNLCTVDMTVSKGKEYDISTVHEKTGNYDTLDIQKRKDQLLLQEITSVLRCAPQSDSVQTEMKSWKSYLYQGQQSFERRQEDSRREWEKGEKLTREAKQASEKQFRLAREKKQEDAAS